MTGNELNKREFIDFMLTAEALRFGSFVTKSGRQTPYFVNTGRYCTGSRVAQLGEFYARAIKETLGLEFDNLYGPAYKGIPLAVTTAAALWRLFEKDVTVTFNRKEAKDHGEGGALVGPTYRDGDRVVIIEDVMTAGTSVRETVALLRAAAAVEIVGVIISVDRQERGAGAQSAVQEIAETYGFPVKAIASLDDIIEDLRERADEGAPLVTDEVIQAIEAYRAEYGVR